MDIEQLTKTQIILLTLLVSFVTSIATGIVTVTLMDQAPPAITRTINRVIEKTIQTVVPNTTQTASVKKEIVIVKEQNVVANVVEKTLEVLGRIVYPTDEGEVFVGFGLFVDKSGVVITDSLNITKGKNYSIYIGKDKINLKLLKIDKKNKIAYMKTVESKESIFKSIFKEASIASPESLELGQSIVVIGGAKSTEVLTGIVSGFTREKVMVKNNTASSTSNNDNTDSINNTSDTNNAEITKESNNDFYILGIKTNILPTDILSGAPVLNLKGEVIGINVDSGTSSFIPIDFVEKDIKEILNPPKKVDTDVDKVNK